MSGGQLPLPVALLVLDPDSTPASAELNGITGKTLAELAEDPAVLAEIDRGVAAVNEHFKHAEQVKKWAWIGEEWLPDSPQLTATMKLKRHGVLRAAGSLIEDQVKATIASKAAELGWNEPSSETIYRVVRRG